MKVEPELKKPIIPFQKDDFFLNYTFSSKELAIIAHLLRNNQDKIPEELLGFASQVESAVYNSMSITEVESFYS